MLGGGAMRAAARAPVARAPHATAPPAPARARGALNHGARHSRSMVVARAAAASAGERARLSKALKAHRSRLSAMLTEVQAQPTNPELLQGVLAELQATAEALLRLGDGGGAEAPSASATRAPAPAAAYPSLFPAAAAAPEPPARDTLLLHTLGERPVEVRVPWGDEEPPAPSSSAPRAAPQRRRAAPAAATVEVCTGKHCAARGAGAVLRAMSGLADGGSGVDVAPCRCLGRCGKGPNVNVAMLPGQAEPVELTGVHPARLRAAVEAGIAARDAA